MLLKDAEGKVLDKGEKTSITSDTGAAIGV